MRENKLAKGILLNALGLLFSILPPLLAVLCYFPVWVDRGSEYVLCGVTAMLLLLTLVPLFRLVKQALRSPSGYMIWLVIFILFLALSRIADEMVVISFIGLIGNLIGAVFFRIGARYRNEK